ncbi:hypothetical protein HUN01_29450 [Nostoc edaphicum CCNP1411]|uniref:Uncharacterized protein n=1 Tax=Nostoc edaphicum CCNP1411 TaxID=1472755 RepID=A0A7D7QWR1_9NOSO|nr:hypothetical protein [Nostoc edaphicum]QMS91523.1 hypothetical protein HUN01_29450 [Nostoc edaphicum CCNP1411]
MVYVNVRTSELSTRSDRLYEIHSKKAIAPHLNFVEAAIALCESHSESAIAPHLI